MTDPVTILATIALSTAVAFPIGVAAGRRQKDDEWRENLERAKRIQRADRERHVEIARGSHRKV